MSGQSLKDSMTILDAQGESGELESILCLGAEFGHQSIKVTELRRASTRLSVCFPSGYQASL